MSYTNISHLGNAQSEWTSSLDFYQKDLDILDKRLLEVARKNTGEEAAKGIEHFQNQFDIQRQNISDLRHRIQSNNHQAATDVKKHGGHINELVVDNKEVIGDDMASFEKTMKELRQEFNTFLSKWM
jgi:septation ring formation regulator EzrA